MVPLNCDRSTEKILGGCFGLAMGDALGVPVETKKREWLKAHPLGGLRGGGRYKMPAGTWSDDTSLTIATMQSLIEQKRFDYADMMQKFAQWLRDGEFTATGESFGTGRTTTHAIERYEQGVLPLLCGGLREQDNGNGSLMRMLPTALVCWQRVLEPRDRAQQVCYVSSLTHANEISVLGCYIYTNLVCHLMSGYSLPAAYREACQDDYQMFDHSSLYRYRRVLSGEIDELPETEISSTGYVVDTLEAAIWSALQGESFRDKVLTAVNLGHDTDTVGAIAGSLAGLECGYEALPASWTYELQRERYLKMLFAAFATVLPKVEVDLSE